MLKNTTTDGKLAESSLIYDSKLNKFQEVINENLLEETKNHSLKIEELLEKNATEVSYDEETKTVIFNNPIQEESSVSDFSITRNKLDPNIAQLIDYAFANTNLNSEKIGSDSTTLLIGNLINGIANTSGKHVHTNKFNTFKLELNDGYIVNSLVKYDLLTGEYIETYITTVPENVEMNALRVVVSNDEYLWSVVITKENSNLTINPRENIINTFLSGLHFYVRGTEQDNHSSAQQAKLIINRTIEQLPNEEDLTLVDGKIQMANRFAAIKDGKVANLGYVILRLEKSFEEQVTEPNCIYEVRYEFDLNGKEVEIPVNCTLKFNGGKIIKGTLKGKETTIEAQLSQILNSVILKGTWANDYFYPEWLGANGDDNINDTEAIQLLINAEVNIKLLAKKYKANVTWNSRSSIIGSGQDKTILEPFDNSKPVILVDVQTNTSSYAPLAYTNRILSDITIHSGLMDSVVAVPTGVGVQMSVEGGKSNVGVIEFTRCAIVGFEYGIKKSYGGLGGNIVNCNFDKNNFHYYAYATSSTSHSGCTLFHKNHFMRGYKAAIYIEYTAAIGGGQDIFDNNIFEHNRGFVFFIKGFKSSTTEMRITNNWFEENSLGNFVEKNPNDISIYDFAPVEINGETYDLAEIYLESSSGIVVENCLLRALTLKSSKITLDSVTPTTSQRYNIPREFVLVKDNDSEVLYKNAVCGTSVIETIVDSQIKLGLSTGSVATNIVADSIKNMPAGRTPSIFRVKNKTRKKALVNSADSAILASSVANVLPFSYNYSTAMPFLNGSWKQMTVIEDDSLLNKNYNRATITAGNTGGFLRGCSVTLDSNIFNYYVIVLSIKSDNPTSPLYIAFGNNAGVWINANDITSEWQTFAVLCNATNWRTVERSGTVVIYTGKYGSAEVTEEFVLDISYLNVIGFNKAEDALSYVNGDYIIDNDMTAEIGTYNTLPTQVTTGKQVYDKDLSKPVIWNGTEWSDALDRKANNIDDSKPMGMGYKVLSPNKSFAEQVTAANTIYEIRYNFDLQGGTVELKDNCTLKFNGGKLINGTIKGVNSFIDADYTKHIFTSITLTGDWENNASSPMWYGGKPNTEDSSAEIQMCFDDIFRQKFIPRGNWNIKNTLLVRGNTNVDVVLEGENVNAENNVINITKIITTDDIPIIKVEFQPHEWLAKTFTIRGGMLFANNGSYSSAALIISGNNNSKVISCHLHTTICTTRNSPPNSIGVLIVADDNNRGYVTYVRNYCNIGYFGIGVKSLRGTGDVFITGVQDYSHMWQPRQAVVVENASAFYIGGEYQSGGYYEGEDKTPFISVDGHNVVIGCKVWDLTSRTEGTHTNNIGVEISENSTNCVFQGLALELFPNWCIFNTNSLSKGQTNIYKPLTTQRFYYGFDPFIENSLVPNKNATIEVNCVDCTISKAENLFNPYAVPPTIKATSEDAVLEITANITEYYLNVLAIAVDINQFRSFKDVKIELYNTNGTLLRTENRTLINGVASIVSREFFTFENEYYEIKKIKIIFSGVYKTDQNVDLCGIYVKSIQSKIKGEMSYIKDIIPTALVNQNKDIQPIEYVTGDERHLAIGDEIFKLTKLIKRKDVDTPLLEVSAIGNPLVIDCVLCLTSFKGKVQNINIAISDYTNYPKVVATIDGSNATDIPIIVKHLYIAETFTVKFQIGIKSPYDKSFANVISIQGVNAVKPITSFDESYSDITNNVIKRYTVGDSRPNLSYGDNTGFQFFDTTLSKPIWWTGEKWVDSTGTEV